MRRKGKKIYLLASLAAVVLIAGVSAYYVTANRNKATSTAVTKGNATQGQPADYSDSGTPTPTPGKGSAVTPPPGAGTTVSPTTAPAVNPPAKPTLNMSSGNAGASVPAGRAMEFTCEGGAGLNCTLVLTDKANAAHQINLGAKAIASNGHGQYSAVWDWTAVAGSWTLVATVTNSGGTAASDPQTLEVK